MQRGHGNSTNKLKQISWKKYVMYYLDWNAGILRFLLRFFFPQHGKETMYQKTKKKIPTLIRFNTTTNEILWR